MDFVLLCFLAQRIKQYQKVSDNVTLPAGSLTGSQCKSLSFSLIHPQSPWSKLQLCMRIPVRRGQKQKITKQEPVICKPEVSVHTAGVFSYTNLVSHQNTLFWAQKKVRSSFASTPGIDAQRWKQNKSAPNSWSCWVVTVKMTSISQFERHFNVMS